MNRRPSGYEGVSAKIPWTDCIKQHKMDDISAYSSVFHPISSNWCVGVFPVVGQNVGQAAMRKTQDESAICLMDWQKITQPQFLALVFFSLDSLQYSYLYSGRRLGACKKQFPPYYGNYPRAWTSHVPDGISHGCR